MNALAIWAGFDYAHTDYISRGIDYYRNANRVKVIAVYKRKDPGKERDTTYVKCTFLDSETGDPKQVREWNEVTRDYIMVDKVKEVRARDIFMRWDEYEDETEALKVREARENAEREARYEQQRQERLERERLYAQQEAERAETRERARVAEEERTARNRQRVVDALRGLGLSNPDSVIVSEHNITIPMDVAKSWFGIELEGVSV